MRNLRDVEKRPCKPTALSIVALLETWKGFVLLGLLREKEKACLGSILDPGDIKS